MSRYSVWQKAIPFLTSHGWKTEIKSIQLKESTKLMKAKFHHLFDWRPYWLWRTLEKVTADCTAASHEHLRRRWQFCSCYRHRSIYCLCRLYRVLMGVLQSASTEQAQCPANFTRGSFPLCVVTILIVDESVTMQSLIPPLLRTLEHVESELTTNGIGIHTPNKYAVVGFGNYQNFARIITVAGQPILRLADVSRALSEIGQDGLWPDGYHEVAHALRNIPLKKKPNSNCVVHLLLATHEPRTADEVTKSRLEELLCEKEVVIFNSLLNFYLQLGSKKASWIRNRLWGKTSSDRRQTGALNEPTSKGTGENLVATGVVEHLHFAYWLRRDQFEPWRVSTWHLLCCQKGNVWQFPDSVHQFYDDDSVQTPSLWALHLQTE